MPTTTTPPKIYTIHDIPRPEDMADYLSRVRAVRDALTAHPGQLALRVRTVKTENKAHPDSPGRTAQMGPRDLQVLTARAPTRLPLTTDTLARR